MQAVSEARVHGDNALANVVDALMKTAHVKLIDQRLCLANGGEMDKAVVRLFSNSMPSAFIRRFSQAGAFACTWL